MKVDNCPCSCCGAQKDVVTIELQGTYDVSVITAVRKANARQVHDNRKTQARFLRISHVASGNPFLKKIVRDSYDWHVKRPFVLRCTYNQFNIFFNATTRQGSNDWQNL